MSTKQKLKKISDLVLSELIKNQVMTLFSNNKGKIIPCARELVLCSLNPTFENVFQYRKAIDLFFRKNTSGMYNNPKLIASKSGRGGGYWLWSDNPDLLKPSIIQYSRSLESTRT